MTADTTTAPERDDRPHGQPITMTYRNYRGEVAERTVTPKRIWWGSTDWHPEPGWLMTAYDPDKRANRDFALADCQFADLSPVAQDAEPVGWFGFEQNTGEFTAEWCSVKPADSAGLRPLYAHPAPQPSDEAATLRAQLADAEKRIEEEQSRANRAELRAQQKWQPIANDLTARAEAAEADRDRFRADVDAVKRHIPMDYLIRHDVPGATGPTEKLDLGSAMRDYAEDRWSLIERYKTAKAALAAAEDHADVLAYALNTANEIISDYDDIAGDGEQQEIDAALAAHQARRAGE